MSTVGDLVGGEIAEHMERQGLSAPQLAARANMSRMTLWRRMNDPDRFTMPEIERISAALRISPLLLFGVYPDA